MRRPYILTQVTGESATGTEWRGLKDEDAVQVSRC